MEKPTVLFILHLPPPVHGAAMVGKYIHDSKVVNETFDCHFINLATADSLQDIGKGGLRKIMKAMAVMAHTFTAVIKLRPKLVYVTPNACGGAFYRDFLVVQLLKLMGCKVVVHYHNKGVKMYQDKWLNDKLYRMFFHGIKVVLLAEALYDDVKKYVSRKNVFICPNGIPDTLAEKPKDKCQNEVPHLLFLSNLLETKGVIVLLDALKILKEKGKSFVCDFVGGETADIDGERFHQEVEQRGLNGLAVYHGRKYGDDKETFYQNSDVLVFPTFYPKECFPLVLLEAMQHGLPCISTREGGIPDIIKEGETGFLVQRKDPEDLANRMSWLIEHNEERLTMGLKSHEVYQRLFTISKFEQSLTVVLGSML